MKQVSSVLLLGDSVLKGIQVEPESGGYQVKNEMGLQELETEFALQIENKSRFGATCLNGAKLLDRFLAKGSHWDAVVMDFGGNDCNYRWEEIAAAPEAEHFPALPLPEFTDAYRALIRTVRTHGMQPVVMTLPPLIPERFFAWWCRGLDQEAVRSWLGDVSNIYAHQERYSRAVERLAWEEQVPLVDVRGAFLSHSHLGELMCADGTHPNTAGQQQLHRALRDFALRLSARESA